MRLFQVLVDERFVPDVKARTSKCHYRWHCILTANVDDIRFPFTVSHSITAVGRTKIDTKHIRLLFLLSCVVACAREIIHTANTRSASNCRVDAVYRDALGVRYVQAYLRAAAVRSSTSRALRSSSVLRYVASGQQETTVRSLVVRLWVAISEIDCVECEHM